MAYVQAGLQQRGFTVDTDLIEAAVKRMNERAKITAWDAFDMDEDEETTAIDVRGKMSEVRGDFFFDLSGRKVENPTKGIYIHNGKKVVFNR